jgi:uncharacterized membrane protein YqaE (UPF0057 family)
MFLRLVCAFFLPPLAVFLTTGLSLAFVINIILTLIGYRKFGLKPRRFTTAFLDL